MSRAVAGARVLYKGQHPGTVLEADEESGRARLRLDGSGETAWLPLALIEPDPAGQPSVSRAWRDREGYLWIEAGEPGSSRVFCYDGGLRRRMDAAWPVRELGDAVHEFGLVPLEPGPREPGEDRVLFLYAGGHAREVHPRHLVIMSGGPLAEEAFTGVIPGYEVALLSVGRYVAEDGECVEGAFVVVRRSR